MSLERLNKNFQNFVETIRNFPDQKIDKSTLIRMLNQFIVENPELENVYDAVTDVAFSEHQTKDSQIDTYSRVEPTEPPQISSRSSSESTVHSNIPRHRAVSSRDPAPFVEKVVIHQGDLKVRKESAVLSPLVKKLGLKTIYGELSAAYQDGEKWAYFTLYQSKKIPKVVYKFVLDESCSFINDPKSKRDFVFRHGSSLELFTVESGTADSWTSRFESMFSHSKIEVYEIPDNFETTAAKEETVQDDTPIRPPPRPARHSNKILPENVFVCLYDHVSTTKDSNELEFHRGDLLYIINRDGPQFYVGHRLTSSSSHIDGRPSLGLVFKDFIQPAYEKSY